MPRVTPVLPPASSSAAVGVDVASSGDGDDDDDGDDVRNGEDVAVVDEDGVSSASPLSSWSPPSDMADSWRSLVGLSSPSVWRESTRLGPSVSGLVRRWCSPDSGFRSLRRDPCLHAAFEELLTESTALLEFAFSSMAASSAAAHALSHASAFIGEFVRRLASFSPDPAWPSFCEGAESAISNDALLPLRDASRCLAHVFGRATSAIRAGVIRHADSSIQPILRTSPPSSEFFFGDPADQVLSSLRLALLSSLLPRPLAPASRGSASAASPADFDVYSDDGDVDAIGDDDCVDDGDYVDDDCVDDDNCVDGDGCVDDDDCVDDVDCVDVDGYVSDDDDYVSDDNDYVSDDDDYVSDDVYV